MVDRSGEVGKMATKTKIAVGAVVIVVAAMIGVLVALSSREPTVLEKDSGSGTVPEQPPVARANKKPSKAKPEVASDRPAPDVLEKKDTKAASDATPDPEPEMTEEDKKEAEEEKKVEEFDAIVDKWMESSKDKVVTMADVDAFRELFRKVPKARKEECVHRALNLIPDDNVMLLAGILFDKEQDKEILDLVYNDILNRDEDVKKPILKEVFKDREHPNWADTAWILDVTGELPANGQNN